MKVQPIARSEGLPATKSTISRSATPAPKTSSGKNRRTLWKLSNTRTGSRWIEPRSRREWRHMPQEVIEPMFREVDERHGIKAEEHHQCPERHERHEFTRGEVEKERAIGKARVVPLAELHALHRPQVIRGGEDDAGAPRGW